MTRSVEPSRFQSTATGVVRHCVRSPLPFGRSQPQASVGCGPSHSTSTGSAAASFGAVRVPTFRYQCTFPQIELTTRSGRPSPSQSATVCVVYPHLASHGPWIDPFGPAWMRITFPSASRSLGAAHRGRSTPGPLRFSRNAM